MKKLMVGMIVAVFLAVSVAPVQAADNRGGAVGFLVGCCFGVRTAAVWNGGKDLHFRDWGRLIPFVNIALAIWDGVDGANGMTTDGLATQYGANYY